MNIKFKSLGALQQPILHSVTRGLPGTAAHYLPRPVDKAVLAALVVISPLFENRGKLERERLVRDSIIAALRVTPSQYLTEIQCFTPAEFEKITDGAFPCEWVEFNIKTREYERCTKPQTSRTPKPPDLDLQFCEEHLNCVEAGEPYLPRNGSSIRAFGGGLPGLGKRS